MPRSLAFGCCCEMTRPTSHAPCHRARQWQYGGPVTLSLNMDARGTGFHHAFRRFSVSSRTSMI